MIYKQKIRNRAAVIIIIGVIFFPLLFPSVGLSALELAVIKSKDIRPYNLTLKGFKDVLDSDLTIKEYILGEDIQQGIAIVDKITSRKPEIILSIGAEAAFIASKNIENIPVLFSLISNPEFYSISGKNISGVKLDIPLKERLENYKKVMPNIKNIGVIFSSDGVESMLKEARSILKSFQISLVTERISSRKELPAAMDKLISKADTIWLTFDPIVTGSPRIVREIILFRALKHKIPVIGFNKWSVTAGALFCIHTDYEEIGRQAGRMANRILNRPYGASNLPVESPKDIKILFNNKVIDRMGSNVTLNIPDNAFIWSGK